ncbi:FemAB family XrtA/PEP-CTERM system-associated protein [Hyphococcus luteus]|uniref:Peptidoglycan bridge formation protein FemAB n=1 Tax=Hyphococcus luteus TaxID=2058213 RepID=A0A2S7K973_9PROT|nr:FemAB family XrtA/PEP-CTERM system-associated protein [Marinicaulis flavus]PQA89009.1 peptidoglycan bridge formation protein FemAB [Marinicaulis flavus]
MTAAPALRFPSIEVTHNTSCDRARWDAYVRAHHEGTFFHLIGWGEAAKRAYGYDAHYLAAKRDGGLAGVLMLTEARTPLLGASLVATAFSVGGGPLADDEEARDALLAAAAALGAEKRVNYVECRSGFDAPGWETKTGLHASFEAPLIADEQEALAAIPRKRRAEIRKAVKTAQKGALSIRHDGGADLFYRLYAQSLHRLGTPVFPKRFLDALLAEFPQETEISVVEDKGKPVAALLSFYFKDAVLPYYVGAGDDARASRAFDYLYWSVMRRAAGKGFTRFDFGRSKTGSGAYLYKKLWGFEPRPLSYQVKLIGADELPDVNATNPKFALFSKLWPHLPLGVANRLGPALAPNFP